MENVGSLGNDKGTIDWILTFIQHFTHPMNTFAISGAKSPFVDREATIPGNVSGTGKQARYRIRPRILELKDKQRLPLI